MAELPPTEKALQEALRNAKKPSSLRASESIAEASKAGPDTNPRTLSPAAQVADARARQAAQVMAQQQAEKQLQAERLKAMGITDLSVVWGDQPKAPAPRGKKAPAVPPTDPDFEDLKARFRKRFGGGGEKSEWEQLVAKYALYAGVGEGVGVVPATVLGGVSMPPDAGGRAFAGVNIASMTDKEREKFLSRVPVEQQEALFEAWAAKSKGGR